MDRRGCLGLALCLLSGSVGCQHQVTTLSPSGQSTSSLPAASSIDPAKIKKVELPKKDPPPQALVSSGDFKAGEAFAADVPPQVQQVLREEARQDYERALKIDPKFLPAYQGIARLYSAAQEHARAVETYQKALRIAPQNAALWFELGMVHHYQRNWGPALDCLSRATQLDPSNRSYLNTMGVVLVESGRPEASLTCFVRANGEAMGCYRLAQTLQRLQQPDLSRRYLELALQKDPNLATTLTMQGAGSAAPLQRTSYEAASVPPAPTAPAMPVVTPEPAVPPASFSPPAAVAPAAPAAPVVRLDAIEEHRPAPQPILVPPPPPVRFHY
jgi:Tfp pilus assembly protein PilF